MRIIRRCGDRANLSYSESNNHHTTQRLHPRNALIVALSR